MNPVPASSITRQSECVQPHNRLHQLLNLPSQKLRGRGSGLASTSNQKSFQRPDQEMLIGVLSLVSTLSNFVIHQGIRMSVGRPHMHILRRRSNQGIVRHRWLLGHMKHRHQPRYLASEENILTRTDIALDSNIVWGSSHPSVCLRVFAAASSITSS